MNEIFTKPIVALMLTTAVCGYYWRSTSHDLRQAQTEIKEQATRLGQLQTENAALKQKISELGHKLTQDEDHITDYSKQAANESKELQALETELEVQRKRVEEKRKQYESLKNNANPDVYTAAKIKMVNDELLDLGNQFKSLSEEIGNTNSEADAARANRKRDSQLAQAQAFEQVAQEQGTIKAMEEQRAVTARDRTLAAPNRQQLLRDRDAQIAIAKGTLSALKIGQGQTLNEQRTENQVLDTEIKKSFSDLHANQDEVRKKIDARKAELFKLQEHQMASGNFDKERGELINRLAADLKDETAKLAGLEARVHEQKIKAQTVPK